MSIPHKDEIAATACVLKGRYEIGPVCGHGGMARVHNGLDLLLGRSIAIKLLTHLTDDMIQRFEREARILSQLSHPNIGAIYDFGVEGDLHFMIMEWIEGKSLDQFLVEDSVMDSERAIPILLQVGEGLAAAHEHGVVHRDVKPENILVATGDEKEQIRLIDFGLAISDGQIKSNDRLTTHGYCVGTQRYMAPEQMDGKHPTPATDIYAFGLVCAELLAGPQSISGGRLIITESPSRIERFWPIIKKACKENPSERWQNMREMLTALQKQTQTTRLQRHISETRRSCVNLVQAAVGQRPQERILAAVSVVLLGLLVLLNFGREKFQGPRITLENTGIVWSAKNQIHVRVMGMAERANPTQLFIETSIRNSQGELIPDPTSTVIDKMLHASDSLKISNSLQSLDKDFRFKLPSRKTDGFVHVQILDKKRTPIAQQKIPLIPPVKSIQVIKQSSKV